MLSSVRNFNARLSVSKANYFSYFREYLVSPSGVFVSWGCGSPKGEEVESGEVQACL